MTQEEKDLLFKDLCARLPYGIKCCDFCYNDEGGIINTVEILECIYPSTMEYKYKYVDAKHDIERIKPYLRPMSSITDEERQILEKLSNCYIQTKVLERNRRGKIKKQISYLDNEIKEMDLFGDNDEQYSHVSQQNFIDASDFFNSHHFDYRGLIEKGLALEAPKDMYNFNTKTK